MQRAAGLLLHGLQAARAPLQPQIIIIIIDIFIFRVA